MADALDLDALEQKVELADMLARARTERGYKYEDGIAAREQLQAMDFTARYGAIAEAEAAANEVRSVLTNPRLVRALIARCRAAEQRADNAEGQVAAVKALCGDTATKWIPIAEVRAALAPRAEAIPEDIQPHWRRDELRGGWTDGERLVTDEAVRNSEPRTRKATPERVILTEDPTVGAIETAAGASTPAVDPAS